MTGNERTNKALEEIAKSLSFLESETKAQIRQEEYEKLEKFFLLETKDSPSDLKGHIIIFILGFFVGCMLFQLGISLLK